jgi:Ni,Fe-hydrogenase maturation factor
MTRILVFGNPLLDEDSLPLRLLPEMRKRMPDMEFVETDPNDMPQDEDLVIIDTAVGIKDVVLIDDIKKLETSDLMSMHEMDLGQTLTLMQAAGLLKEVKIIAVPMGMSPSEALDKTEKMLRSI